MYSYLLVTREHSVQSGTTNSLLRKFRSVPYTNRIQHFFRECRLLGYYAVWILLETDVSEECIACIIRPETISEKGSTLAVTSS
jgi:hypothetical protein